MYVCMHYVCAGAVPLPPAEGGLERRPVYQIVDAKVAGEHSRQVYLELRARLPRKHVYMYVCMYVFMYIYIYVYIYI